MTEEQIKTKMLDRLYQGAFVKGVEYAPNLNEFAEEIGVEKEDVWEIFQQLKDLYLVEAYAAARVRITSNGILHYESNQSKENKLINHQLHVRTILLDTAMHLRDENGRNSFIYWSQLCSEAGVEEQDFYNNIRFLTDLGLLEKIIAGSFQITQYGIEQVKDYRQRVARLNEFNNLISMNGTNPQSRGHKLEDLLVEVARNENWKAESRVRSQGQEHDIIMNVGLHYFIVSCKWEKSSIQPKEVELLESRVRSRATTNGGLLFSMSGFTKNCIDEARLKISSAQILLFGKIDIQRVIHGESSLTDLLELKLEYSMHHRKIYIDGRAY